MIEVGGAPCNVTNATSLPSTVVCRNGGGAAKGAAAVTVSTLAGAGFADLVAPREMVAAPTVLSVSPTRGQLNAVVRITILGFDFLAAAGVVSGVTVGGEICDVVATAVNSIQCDLPAVTVAGTGVVSVASEFGGLSLANPNATFTWESGPSLDGIAPTNGPSDGGTLVTISGSFLARFAGDILGVRVGSAAAAIANYTGSDPVTAVTIVTPSRPAGTLIVVVVERCGELSVGSGK